MKNELGRTRQDRFESAANSAGECWAAEEMGSLRAERRAIAGGWPGTIAEARSRSRRCIVEALRDDDAAATAEEIERASRTLYARAKRAWNSVSAREDAPE